MKLMSELESLRLIYPISVSVHYCMQHTLILGCATGNFLFCAIAKNAGTFGRDLGAKFSINDPKNEINHQNMLAEEWSRNCHF